MTNDKLHYLFFILFLVSCQPKAEIATIDNPMSSFAPSDDSVRGATSIQELACYLFLSLKGDLPFDSLTAFIPDSENIAAIYQITHTETKNANLKANADTVLHQLKQGWIKTRSEASELKANWSSANFEQLQIQTMENQRIPSKIITLKCKSGDVTLRASAKCMMIGDRWYIGEDIKFGT